MSVPQKEYEALLSKYKQLELQLNQNTNTPQTSVSSTTRPKLRSFRNTKFNGRRDDFEAFRLRYDAERSLSADDFNGWSQSQCIAFLTSALEGEALDVLRASIAIHAPNATHALVWKGLEVAYKDTAEAERALQKIQQLTQKGDLESYIREFNTLCGLAQEAATLNEAVILRYFIQGLAKDFRIAIAATAPRDLAAAQADVRRVELILHGRDNRPGVDDPMDTSEGKQERKFKGTCNWCGYKGHMERECRQKAAGKPRKEPTQRGGNTGKCFRCGRPGHRIAECKAHVVFSAEEENKESQQ